MPVPPSLPRGNSHSKQWGWVGGLFSCRIYVGCIYTARAWAPSSHFTQPNHVLPLLRLQIISVGNKGLDNQITGNNDISTSNYTPITHKYHRHMQLYTYTQVANNIVWTHNIRTDIIHQIVADRVCTLEHETVRISRNLVTVGFGYFGDTRRGSWRLISCAQQHSSQT